MIFKHPLINRSWLTYEIDRNRQITTVLHVEPVKPIPPDSGIETELADAIRAFMRKRTNIDRVIVVPRDQ